MNNETNNTSFAELALALANDYESIYVINSADDSYVEYTSAGAEKELVLQDSGENFFEDVIQNCRRLVWPEDQGRFLRVFRKEKMLAALENGKSFDLRYRLIIDDKPQYYYLKTIRKNSEDIIIGVQNVDKQTRLEMEEDHAQLIFAEIAKSLSSIYEAIYYIDIETGNYIEYCSSQSYSELGIATEGKNFFINLQNDIEKHIFAEDRDMLLQELDKQNLLRTLQEKKRHSIVYRQELDGRMQYLSLVVFRQFENSDHLVAAVRNVDSQIRHNDRITEENQAFSEIALALAQRYEELYRIDVETDEYFEYRIGEEGWSFSDATGTDFFRDTQRRMKRDIFPDDYPMMSVAMNKEHLLNNLRESGKLFLNYRLMVDGEPRYFTLFAVRPKEDSGYIIVAVANVDYVKRKELAFEEAVGSAMNMANRDALTGLKNKRYYAQNEMKLDKRISEGQETAFAIVICDVNGLKEINATKGFKFGDQTIVEAGDMIGKAFPGSEVYRIGGDEFAVILEGEEYENRENLIGAFSGIQAANRESGRVNVSLGMAEYDRGADFRVQDVFERACSAMQVNKQSLRGTLEKENAAGAEALLNLSADEKKLAFYELYVQLVSRMTDITGNVAANVSAIEDLLIRISKMYRLSKGVTRIYRNLQEEAEGGGETLCCFDTGIQGKEIIYLRTVTSVMSIATMTVYMAPDEQPLSDEERWRVELTMRTTLSYVSRNRLKDIVYGLAYYDDDGYENHRSYFRSIMMLRDQIGGMVAVMYNLLHFSQVNQELGRKNGNLVMKNHFEGLRNLVGENGVVCRLGGDNFVALFNRQRMGDVFAYLNGAQVVYDVNEGKTVNISTSVGVYRIPKDIVLQNPGQIMECITVAYSAAKMGGKDRVVFYDESLLTARDNIMRIQRMFPFALQNEEFKVYYQPKVHTETGELIGAEALCRWFHDGEMISPGAFIPMLEQTDDICKLDFYMLDHVCRDIRRWIDQGKKVVRISVNLSRKHMMNRNLLEQLMKIIDRHNVPHSCLEIELTETTTDVAFSDLKRVVTGLQSAGLFASVDDFGIGYSSLNLIRELPWNVLKVDRSILPEEDDEPESVNSIMFRYVIAMVNELGIECIVEGVETEKQLEILRENKCLYAQGFLFDRPLPVREFEERMDRRYYSVPEN